jgi:hypothetical protein
MPVDTHRISRPPPFARQIKPTILDDGRRVPKFSATVAVVAYIRLRLGNLDVGFVQRQFDRADDRLSHVPEFLGIGPHADGPIDR